MPIVPSPRPGARLVRACIAADVARVVASLGRARRAVTRVSRMLACVLPLALASWLAGARPAAAVALPPGFADHVVATGLDLPTAFAFLPDGRALVVEQRSGAIRLVVGGTVATTPLVTVAGLDTVGMERGALAIAVDPAWPLRPYVYVHATVDGPQLELVRYTATGTLTGPTSFELALGSPYLVLNGIADLNPIHNGGALRFAPDGRLLYSLGEDADDCQAQDPTTLHGALLRLDVSALPAGAGGPPARTLLACPDNPFIGSRNTSQQLVWAYGLRNPFRFVVDPADGTAYVADVGDNTWEELDAVGPGFNGGWPFREGPALHTGSSCSEPGGPGHSSYDAPIDSYDHNEGLVIVAAGVVRYRFGSAWPVAWDGNVLYADFFMGFLRMLTRTANGWQRATVAGQPDPLYFGTGLVAPVDFAWGPNGDLYWLQQDGGFDGARHAGALHRIHAGEPVAVGAPEAAPRLALAVSPNPMGATAELRYALPAGGRVRLSIFDVSGRSVRALVDATLPGGAHLAHWDGLDAAGRSVPPGVYLVRLEGPVGAATARLARVR